MSAGKGHLSILGLYRLLVALHVLLIQCNSFLHRFLLSCACRCHLTGSLEALVDDEGLMVC